MVPRQKIHDLLVEALGSEHVYFQPPENLRMKYPAIVYSMADVDKSYADNSSYIATMGYEIIVIDRDPDSDVVKRVACLPLCRFDRSYAADGLNHSVFTMYY